MLLYLCLSLLRFPGDSDWAQFSPVLLILGLTELVCHFPPHLFYLLLLPPALDTSPCFGVYFDHLYFAQRKLSLPVCSASFLLETQAWMTVSIPWTLGYFMTVPTLYFHLVPHKTFYFLVLGGNPDNTKCFRFPWRASNFASDGSCAVWILNYVTKLRKMDKTLPQSSILSPVPEKLVVAQHTWTHDPRIEYVTAWSYWYFYVLPNTWMSTCHVHFGQFLKIFGGLFPQLSLARELCVTWSVSCHHRF